MLNDKTAVSRILREISQLLQVKGENSFKSRAYDMGADRIAGLNEDLATLVAEGRLEELPNIGEALAKKIAELVTTGKMTYFENLRAEFPPRLLELLRVQALGPKKVAALWKQLGVTDVPSLETACKEHKVRDLKGFGEKTEQKILDALELLKRAKGRFLLGEARPVAEELLASVRAVPGVIRASIGGSTRRWAETVSDVDIIASAENALPVLETFAKHPRVAQVLGSGESKCSVRLWENDLQVDLRVLPDEDFATALHHFTGSKAHHIRLRGLAQDRGLKISEWGVHRGEEKLSVKDESVLYGLLGMQYVPPELREDWGEIEAALEQGVPSDLLTLEDVNGITHSHSSWSDGNASLEQMANTARELGLKYLTVTEHSQIASYANGLSLDRLREQWDEIDRLNETFTDFRLIKGIEVDILDDGALDFPDNVLDKLEIVIASIHTRHQLDEAAMTKRVLHAFDNPFVHVFGHPTGRLINTRPAYGLKLEAVFEKAAARGVVVEVNGNPHRLDLKAEQVRQALKAGVKLVVSSDSHSREEVRTNLMFAVATARKGWARKGDVLNTLPPDAFVRSLKELRGGASLASGA
ncbi:MAG: DNA polymerase/3'-5' exonuclease PolX [Myxococcaceae bacterium]